MIVYLVKVKDQDQYRFFNPNYYTKYLFKYLDETAYISLITINDDMPEINCPEYSYRYYTRVEALQYIK